MPIVAGVTIAYFVSCVLMRTTIMTEKLARRGVVVASEYTAVEHEPPPAESEPPVVESEPPK